MYTSQSYFAGCKTNLTSPPGFDLMDHSVLVSELRDLGVHEALIRWIGAFLTGRSKLVVLSPTALFQEAVFLRGQD